MRRPRTTSAEHVTRQSRRSRSWRLAAVLVVMGVIAAACPADDPTGSPDASESRVAQPSAEGVFSVNIVEPTSLVPGNNQQSVGYQVLSSIFVGLVAYDPATGDPINVMAESITTDDNITWTIKLKDGFTFHNGEPVTAKSFVQSWNETAYGPNGFTNNGFFSNIEGYAEMNPEAPEGETEAPEPTATELSGLTAPDDLTIVVVLSAPFGQFPTTLGYQAFYPLPDAYFDDKEGFNEMPIGNGRFMMDGPWEHDVIIKVTRNDDYPEDGAKAAGVDFVMYTDLNTAYNDLLAGNLDILDQLPPEQLEGAEEALGERLLTNDAANLTFLGLPVTKGKFANVDFRRALSVAIDRQAIADAVFGSTETPATAVAPPVVTGSRTDVCTYCVFDPELANELLEKAGGWDEDDVLTIWFNAEGAHSDWIEAIANLWSEHLGIESQFLSMLFSPYLGKLIAGEVDGPYRLGWSFDFPSIVSYLQPLAYTGGDANFTGYSSDAFDTLIDAANAAATNEEGIESYQAAEDILLDELPFIPLWWRQTIGARSERVSNVSIDVQKRVVVEAVEVND